VIRNIFDVPIATRACGFDIPTVGARSRQLCRHSDRRRFWHWLCSKRHVRRLELAVTDTGAVDSRLHQLDTDGRAAGSSLSETCRCYIANAKSARRIRMLPAWRRTCAQVGMSSRMPRSLNSEHRDVAQLTGSWSSCSGPKMKMS